MTGMSEGGVTAAYGYDTNGNRSYVQYNNGLREEYAYNLANLLTGVTNKNSAGAVLSGYTYEYRLDGNQTKKTENTGKITTYSYDYMGRLSVESESVSGQTQSYSYLYDDYGNRSKLTAAGSSAYVTDYAYDLNSRLLSEVKTEGGSADTTLYFYDPNGNQISKTTERLSSAGAPEISLSEEVETAEYIRYNGINQVVETKLGGNTVTYAYNPAGIRISKTVNGVATQFVLDGGSNILERTGGVTTAKYIRGINLVASVTGGGTSYYLYNGHGDVVQLTNAAGAVTRTYDYDAFGNETSTDYIASMGDFNTFVNGSKSVLERPDGQTKEALHLGPDDPYGLAQTGTLSLSAGEVYILEFDYWADVNGCAFYTDLYPDDLPQTSLTPTTTVQHARLEISSDSLNMVDCVLRFVTYGGAGNVYVSNVVFYAEDGGASGDANPYRYAGEYFDRETGTYYLRARYYDPAIGRFTSEDPIRDGVNWYTYCGGNPIRFIDPSGLKDIAVRSTIEGLGGTVNWNSRTDTATIYLDGQSVTVYAGDKNGSYIDKNGKMHTDDAWLFLTLASTFDLGKGWTGRIERHGSGDGYKKHVHVYNGKQSWSQNEDGSPHDQGGNSPGSPPNSVLKNLNKQKGWDWKTKESDWMNKIEVQYWDSGYTIIVYPNGRSVTVYKPVSYYIMPYSPSKQNLRDYSYGPTYVDLSGGSTSADPSIPFLPMPNPAPLPVPAPMPLPVFP
jgi:RHS repeat-associated protein